MRLRSVPVDMAGDAGVQEERVDAVEGWQPHRRQEGAWARLGIVVGSTLAVAVVVGVGSLVAAHSVDRQSTPAAATTAQTGRPERTAPDHPTTAPSPGPTEDAPAGEQLPVTLQAAGWTCLPAADEKFECSNGRVGAAVTVRPADQHDAYVGDPDKAAPGQYVSDVHDGWFATLTIFPADAGVSVTDLGAALVWR